MSRIYLDNAATSWPKPPEVHAAMERYQREVGAAAGRGAYNSAVEAVRIVSATRGAVAKLIGTADPNRIVFTSNGTEALNLAIQGLLRPGDHVVTTVCEHNSVLRPLAMLRDTIGIGVDHAGCNRDGVVSVDDITGLIRPETKLVAVTSASNVTGALQPVEQIGKICHERGIQFLVDAAQSLGHPSSGHSGIDVQASHITLLAAPGHKGLLGPLGTGLLYIAPGLERDLRPLLLGGTGVNSDQETPPKDPPERYEAGNLNVPALAGLLAGIEYGAAQQEQRHSSNPTQRLVDALTVVPKVKLFGPPASVPRAPVVSFAIEGYDPHEVAAILAGEGIECRSGLHCSPRLHRALGTDRQGGTVRVSPSFATTDAEIDRAIEFIATLAAVENKRV